MTDELVPADDRHWYRALGSPQHVLAPMVDQSEHAFRVLCKNHGVGLCYSPMISARQFAESELYRRTIFGPLEGFAENEDRPLVVQFAGNDPDVLLAAARHVEHRCDAVDINFGCPQKIAKRGRYGAWLSDEPQLQQRLVGTLHCHLACPVTCKIRLQEEHTGIATVDYARMLQDAGATLVAVHGRTRAQKGALQGSASWEGIAAVKAALRVPVLANGGIFTSKDVRRCLEATGADGVMAGEGLLDHPDLFEQDEASLGSRQLELSREYLDLQAKYPADLRSVKQHLFSLMYAHLQVHVDLRERMHKARTLDDMRACVDECAERPPTSRAPFCTVSGDAYTSWYRRHAWEAERRAAKLAAAAAAPSAADAASGGVARREDEDAAS
jgi:tRNA-dihydrouridine synthase 1